MMNKNVIYALLVLMSIQFFSFRPWVENENAADIIRVIGVVLLVSSLAFYKKSSGLFFGKEVVFFLATFVLSSVSSYLLYGQSFYASLKGSANYFFAAGLYFLAHKYEIKEDFIFKLLLICTLFFTAMEIIEQFTYPNYWFCGRVEKEGRDTVEMRMGLWRMYIFGIYIVLLAYSLFLQKIVQGDNTRRNLIYLAIAFVGIVCYVSRKDIYAAASIVPLAFLFSRGSRGIKTKFVLGLFIIAALMVVPSMMEDLNSQTSMEIGDEDFIRYVAAQYFIFDMNSSPLYYLFGAGIPSGNSSLNMHVSELVEYYGIYQSDCGIVGYFSKVGILGVLSYILIIAKIIKNYKYVDIGLLLFLVLIVELSFFDFIGQRIHVASTFFIYLYLVECNINKNKQESGLIIS